MEPRRFILVIATHADGRFETAVLASSEGAARFIHWHQKQTTPRVPCHYETVPVVEESARA